MLMSYSSLEPGEDVLLEPQKTCIFWLLKDILFLGKIVRHILQVCHSLQQHHSSKIMLEVYYLLT